MEIHVYLNGARRGPFTEEHVQSLLADGVLLPTDLAVDEATTDWKPLSAFRKAAAIEPLPAKPAIEPAAAAAKPPVLATGAPGPDAHLTLAPNETAHYRTSLHWFIFVRFALAGVALFIFAAIPFAIAVQALTGSELGWFVLPLPTFLLLPPAFAFASSEIVVTDRRLLIKAGIVRRQTVEMFISRVEAIAVDQGFLGRMFDFGKVTVRGTGGFQEAFDSIAHPLQFRNWVQQLQSGERAGGEKLASETDVAVLVP